MLISKAHNQFSVLYSTEFTFCLSLFSVLLNNFALVTLNQHFDSLHLKYTFQSPRSAKTTLIFERGCAPRGRHVLTHRKQLVSSTPRVRHVLLLHGKAGEFERRADSFTSIETEYFITCLILSHITQSDIDGCK